MHDFAPGPANSLGGLCTDKDCCKVTIIMHEQKVLQRATQFTYLSIYNTVLEQCLVYYICVQPCIAVFHYLFA